MATMTGAHAANKNDKIAPPHTTHLWLIGYGPRLEGDATRWGRMSASHGGLNGSLKLELRRALQVSAEGFTERHIAAQLTEPQWLDRVDTAIARWPTAAAST